MKASLPTQDPGRFWDTIDKWEVNSLYTAPTAIRALAKEGLEYVKKIQVEKPQSPRNGGRTDQSRSLDVVLGTYWEKKDARL